MIKFILVLKTGKIYPKINLLIGLNLLIQKITNRDCPMVTQMADERKRY